MRKENECRSKETLHESKNARNSRRVRRAAAAVRGITLMMTFKPRIGFLLTFLPAYLLSVNGLQAQFCSTQTTVGRYMVTCDGYLSFGPNAPLAPAKMLGTATADDNGTFIGSVTISTGGPTLTQGVKGTEQLKSDCTGNITYATTLNGQPGPPLDITFVVSEHGDRIDGLPTNPGTVLSCVLRRLSGRQSSQSKGIAPMNKEISPSRSATNSAPVQGPLVAVQSETGLSTKTAPHQPAIDVELRSGGSPAWLSQR